MFLSTCCGIPSAAHFHASKSWTASSRASTPSRRSETECPGGVGQCVAEDDEDTRKIVGLPTPLYSITGEMAGATIVLTGATGYIGSLVLEQLLRTTDVARVYVLVRGRRGASPRQRLTTLLGGPQFHLLRGRPSLTDKVVAVEGDLHRPELGLAASDRDTLVRDADVIIHCAADIRLEVDVQTSLRANFQGTQRILDLAAEAYDRGRGKLRAYVHVSTAFVNMHQPPGSSVAERMYPLRLSDSATMSELDNPDEIVSELMALDPAAAEARAEAICAVCDVGNNYILGKHLAERLVARAHRERTLPPRGTAIVRPSLVAAVSRAPLPGYCGNFAGPIAAGAAAVTGLYGPLDGVAFRPLNLWDMVPGDMVASVILAAAAAGSACVAGALATIARDVAGGRAKTRTAAHALSSSVVAAGTAATSNATSSAAADAVVEEPGALKSSRKAIGLASTIREGIIQSLRRLVSCAGTEKKLFPPPGSSLPRQKVAQAKVVLNAPCCGADIYPIDLLIVHACSSSTYPFTFMEGWKLHAEFITAHPPPFSLRGSMSVLPRMPSSFEPRPGRMQIVQARTGARVGAVCALLRLCGYERVAARLSAGYASMVVLNVSRTDRSLVFETHALATIEARLSSKEKSQRLLVWRAGPSPADIWALSGAYLDAPVLSAADMDNDKVIAPMDLQPISWRAFFFTQLAGMYASMFRSVVPREVDAAAALGERQRHAWWRRLMGVAGWPETWSSVRITPGQVVVDGTWVAATAMGVVRHDFVMVKRSVGT